MLSVRRDIRHDPESSTTVVQMPLVTGCLSHGLFQRAFNRFPFCDPCEQYDPFRRTRRLHLTAARAFRSAVWENLNIVFALSLPPRRR